MSQFPIIITAYAIAVLGWMATHLWLLLPVTALGWILLVATELRSMRRTAAAPARPVEQALPTEQATEPARPTEPVRHVPAAERTRPTAPVAAPPALRSGELVAAR